MQIKPKNYDWRNQSLFSQRQFESHLELYHGYIDKVNKDNSDTYSANGVILHERFFDIICDKKDNPRFITRNMREWKEQVQDFKELALKSRGWVIFGYSPLTENWINILLDSHDNGYMIDLGLSIVLDCYEHSFFYDFLNNKERYIDEFLDSITR